MNSQQTRVGKQRLRKLPMPVGKAQQQLSQAIICGDDELAAWIAQAVRDGQIDGSPTEIAKLRKRLDRVMAPVETIERTEESDES